MSCKIVLFDQFLDATLIQPLKYNSNERKEYRTRVKLKILEQRSESTGEKEFEFELSHDDDYEFFFTEIINRRQYRKLARYHNSLGDFDSFPKIFTNQFFRRKIGNDLGEEGKKSDRLTDYEQLADIELCPDAGRMYCDLDIYLRTPITKYHEFSLKLFPPRGEQLNSYLRKVCSKQAAELSNFRKTRAELESFKIKCNELENQNSALEVYKDRYKKQSEIVEELEDELELMTREKEKKDDFIAKLQADRNKLKRELKANKKEHAIFENLLEKEQFISNQYYNKYLSLQKEASELQVKDEMFRREIKNLNQSLKQNYSQRRPRSMDSKTVQEQEADLKPRDLVDNLNKEITIVKEESMENKLETRKATDSYEKLNTENKNMTESMVVYRDSHYGLAPSTSGLTPIGPQEPTASPSEYKKVRFNIPHGSRNTQPPFRDATNARRNSLPATLQSNSHINDDWFESDADTARFMESSF